MNLVEELLGLVDELHAQQVEYAVCGGVALAIHGYPRFTKDIDLLVQPDDLDRVRAAAIRCGFILEGGLLWFGSGTEKERAIHRLSKAEGSEILTLDLLLVGLALVEVWVTRTSVEWRGRSMSVVSRDGLVRMKRLAGRAQDMLDVEQLDEGDERQQDG